MVASLDFATFTKSPPPEALSHFGGGYEKPICLLQEKTFYLIKIIYFIACFKGDEIDALSKVLFKLFNTVHHFL